jgi:outer membrane protein assembly factor BamD
MNLNKFLSLFLIIFLASCSGKEEQINVVEEQDIELQMIEAYEKGKKALEEGEILFAAKMFNEAELLYPQSEWAPRSSLMAAYAYYSQNYYDDAIFELKRFLKIYPLSPNQDYAHFLLAMCYYENIVDEKKDLEPLHEAKKRFEYIVETYPNSDFALDSKFKIDLVVDILAAKELYLAKHYIKKEKWIPAINRLKYVVENFETTIHIEEALYRLVGINYRLGLVEESKKYASILGYNYQSSKWYEESYRILNPQYISKIQRIKKEKKRSGNFLTRKIKRLFE